MLNSLRVMIHHQVNFITTLLIELEIIFMYVYVSLQLDKNSGIDLENSQLYSMNVQLIGFYLGLKRHLYLLLSHLLRNLKNLIPPMTRRFNWWSIWAMFIWWWLIFVEAITPKWEGRYISLQNHILVIFRPIKNYIFLSIRN